MTDHASLANQLFAAIDAGDWQTMAALLHPAHRFHFPLAPAPLDREEHVATTRAFAEAFSDFRHHVAEQFVAGDKVVSRGTISAVHSGEFNGIAATGRPVEFGFINILQVADGKNREEWVELNAVALMQAIG